MVHRLRLQADIKWFCLALAAIGMAILFSRALPPAYDFHGLFYPVIRAVLEGRFSYASQPIYTNPPWTLVMLLPLGLFTADLARGLLLVATLLAMAWAMRDYRRFTVSYPLAIISLPFLAMLWLGQIEGISILGALLGYRAVTRRSAGQLTLALLLMLVKPQETWLIICLLLIGSARQWSMREWVKIVAGVIGVAAINSLVFGFGWITRILSSPTYAGGWQNFSLWQLGAEALRMLVAGVWLLLLTAVVWSLSVAGISRLDFARAAVGSNLLSPYLTGPHLLMTVVFGWGLLFNVSPRWGIVAYVTSLTPLLRVATGNQDLNRLDLIFPFVVFIGLLVQTTLLKPRQSVAAP
jgi:hypothetical protein